MIDRIQKDVGAAMFASMVKGIVYYHAFHLKLLVTYGEIAAALNTLPRGGQLAQALAQITEDDIKNKRPISTAVVVNSETKMPGKGFFDQCRALGCPFPNFHGGGPAGSEERAFWEKQIQKMGVAPFYLSELDQIPTRPDHDMDEFGRVIVMKLNERREMLKNRAFNTPPTFDRANVAEGIGPMLSWLVEATKDRPTLKNAPGKEKSVEASAGSGQNVPPTVKRRNGGVECDTDEGPCACKAWHTKEPSSVLPT